MEMATARLDRHPVTLPVIEALLADDVALADRLAPYPVSPATFAGDTSVLRMRRDQLRADPTELPWLYCAAVLRSTGEVVARAGFHAPPDADGTVEIGYRVAPEWRRRGLATELATALLGWAAVHGARRCLASTAPDNAGSQRILAGLGFVRVGEQWDEEDGLEWTYALQRLLALR